MHLRKKNVKEENKRAGIGGDVVGFLQYPWIERIFKLLTQKKNKNKKNENDAALSMQ